MYDAQKSAFDKKEEMRKCFVVMTALVCMAAVVFAQGTSESSTGKTSGTSSMRLAWWGNPTRDERTIKASELYMQQHPEVKIETETTGWSGYWDKMNTQAAAGSLPDLMQHDYAYMLQWVNRNQLKPLDAYVKSNVIDLSDVNPSFLESGKVNGKLYGVNLGSNAVCLTYDPAVLKAAGIPEPDDTTWTWDDFERIALTIYQKTGVKTMPFFATDPKVGFDNLIRQSGAATYASDGKGLGFTDSSVLKEYYAIQLRLLEAGALIDPEVAFVNTTPAESEFAKGRSWVEWLWSNQFVAYQAGANRSLKLALLPQIKNPVKKGTFLKASMFFAIPASAKNPDEAAKFINAFTNDIGLNDILMGERGVPIATKVREHMSGKLDEVNQEIFAYIGHAAENSSAIDPPDPPKSGEFLKMFRDQSMAILMKQVSLDEGVKTIMEKGNQILQ
jgi:multiple sugar transport system substrate-binding protein